MLKHGISSGEVRYVLESGERIEEYPDDTPLPSYLMLGIPSRVLHVVAADSPVTQETIVITTYEPNAIEWELDFKTRRRA
jgi:hypothetical protein